MKSLDASFGHQVILTPSSLLQLRQSAQFLPDRIALIARSLWPLIRQDRQLAYLRRLSEQVACLCLCHQGRRDLAV